MEVFQVIPLALLSSLNCSGVLSYLLEFLAWGFGLPSDLYVDTRQCRLSFLELTHKLFWNILLTELIQRVAALPLSFCLA